MNFIRSRQTKQKTAPAELNKRPQSMVCSLPKEAEAGQVSEDTIYK